MEIDLRWEKIVSENGIEHRYLVDGVNYFFLIPSGYKLKKNIEKSIKNMEGINYEISETLLKILHSLNEDIIFATIIKLHFYEPDFSLSKSEIFYTNFSPKLGTLYLDFALEEDIHESYMLVFFTLLKNYRDCMVETILNISNMAKGYDLKYKSKNNSLNFTKQFETFELMFKKIPLTDLFVDIFYLFKTLKKVDVSIDINLPYKLIAPLSFEEVINSFKNEEYSNFIGLLYLPIEPNRLNFTFNIEKKIQAQDIKELSKLIKCTENKESLLSDSNRYFKEFINEKGDITDLKRNATEIFKIKLKRLLKHREDALIKIIEIERNLNIGECSNDIVDDIKLLEKRTPEFKNKIYFMKDYIQRNLKYKLEKSKNINYLINGFIESSEVVFQLSSPFFKRDLSFERTSYLKWKLKELFKEKELDYEIDIKAFERSYKNEINYKPLESIFEKINKIDLINGIKTLKIDFEISPKETTIKKEKEEEKRRITAEEQNKEGKEDEKDNKDKESKYKSKKNEDKRINWFLNRAHNTLKKEMIRKDIIEKEEIIFQMLTVNKNNEICLRISYIEIVKNFLLFVEWYNQKNKSEKKISFLEFIADERKLLKNEIKDYLKSHENDLKNCKANVKKYYVKNMANNPMKEIKIKRFNGNLGINASDLKNFENGIKIAVEIYLDIYNGKLKSKYNFYDEIKKEYPYIVKGFDKEPHDNKLSHLSYLIERQEKNSIENKVMIKKYYFEVIDYYIKEGRNEIKI